MRKKIVKKIIGFGAALALLGCSVLLVGSRDSEAAKYVDLNGKYHAALGLQTCNKVWINRFAYYDKEANQYYGTDKAGCMIAADPSASGKEYAGTFKDVEIAGNGTYTVALEDADFGGETALSQLHVATDIPLNKVIKFKNVFFTINGKKIATFDQGYMEDEEPYINGGMDILLLNSWREPLVDQLEKKGRSKKQNGYNLLKGTGKENISITFTVTGFNYNYGETPSKEKAYVMPKVPSTGSTKTIKGITYKVIKSDKAKGTVSVIKHKKAAGVTIPQTIKWNTYTFRVTEISANAFSKDQKLKKVVIGKNIKKIGKNAFKGCKNLKKITIKTKSLKAGTVGKNALRGCNAKFQVKVPKGKKTLYKNLFKKAGVSRRAVVK